MSKEKRVICDFVGWVAFYLNKNTVFSTVLVLGAGAIGLLASAVAKALGAK